MKNSSLILALICAGPVIHAQTTAYPGIAAISPIPPHTMVELQYQTSSAQSLPGSSKVSSSLYKGQNGSIAIREWPDGRKTYDVHLGKYSFATDPTAPEKYKDYVQVIELASGSGPLSDFPELNFINDQTTVTKGDLLGNPAWILTAAPAVQQYQAKNDKKILAGAAKSPERAGIEKKLDAAEKQQAEILTHSPNRVWINVQNNLPIRAEFNGTVINYIYSPASEPQIPQFIKDAIIDKLGKLPPLD